MECKLNKIFDTKKEYATLALRLAAGGILLAAGLTKFFVYTPAGVAGMLSGFPMPLVFAWLLILTETLGGLALILGFGTRPATVPIIVAMSVATYMHLFVFAAPMAGFNAAQPAILVLAASVSLLFSGSGAYALDNVVWKNCETAEKKK
jgi:putative oxidoreductase